MKFTFVLERKKSTQFRDGEKYLVYGTGNIKLPFQLWDGTCIQTLS
jgi:hypothetical protein